MRTRYGMWMLMLSACGAAPAEQEPAVMIEPMPEADPTCGLTITADREVAGQGALITLTTTLSGLTQTDPTLTLPEGWSRWSDGEGTWTARAPYGVTGVFGFVANVTCDDGSLQSANVDVALQAIRWEEVSMSEQRPARREHPQVWFDPGDADTMYLYGGYKYEPEYLTPSNDLWRLDLRTNTWEELTQEGDAPLFASGRHTQEADSPNIELFGGGIAREGISSESVYALSFESGTPTWSKTSPSALQRSLGAVIYDEKRDRHISVCGIGPSPDREMDCNPRVRKGNAWRLIETPVRPSDRYGFFYGHDPQSQRLVVFSGAGAMPSQIDPVDPQGGAWVLDYSEETPVWTELSTLGAEAAARRNGCGAWDQKNQRLLVWSGTPDARNSSPGLQILHISQDGVSGSWESLSLPGAPVERSSCLGTFDTSRSRMLVGFGNNSFEVYSDLWSLVLE